MSTVVPINPKLTLSPAEQASLMSSLTPWRASEPVPTEIVRRLPDVLPKAENALIPADHKAFAKAMDRLLAWVERNRLFAFSDNPLVRRQEVAGMVDDFRLALADLPADLLAEAIERTIARHSFRNLPLPADIRATVADELRQRTMVRDKLRTADFLSKLRGPEPQFKARPSAEEIAEVAQTFRRAPGDRGDLADRPRPSMKECYAVLTGRPFVERPARQPAEPEAAE